MVKPCTKYLFRKMAMMTAGMIAKTDMTAIIPQLISDALKEARIPSGIVLVLGEVSMSAKRKSFQEKMIQYRAEATTPGTDRGRAILKKA